MNTILALAQALNTEHAQVCTLSIYIYLISEQISVPICASFTAQRSHKK